MESNLGGADTTDDRRLIDNIRKARAQLSALVEKLESDNAQLRRFNADLRDRNQELLQQKREMERAIVARESMGEMRVVDDAERIVRAIDKLTDTVGGLKL
jgi:molecular chaperone GrpE (heat shock protein)